MISISLKKIKKTNLRTVNFLTKIRREVKFSIDAGINDLTQLKEFNRSHKRFDFVSPGFMPITLKN
jgi:hypothetical protein